MSNVSILLFTPAAFMSAHLILFSSIKHSLTRRHTQGRISAALLRSLCPVHVQGVDFQNNLGYAACCIYSASSVRLDLLVCLNPDRGYPVGQLCRSCAPGCVSCEKNATHCLACEEPLLLHKHQCVEECPEGHTARDRQCHQCPTACQECTALGQCTGTKTRPINVNVLYTTLVHFIYRQQHKCHHSLDRSVLECWFSASVTNVFCR